MLNISSYLNALDTFKNCISKLPSSDEELLDQFVLDFIGGDYLTVNSNYGRLDLMEAPEVYEVLYGDPKFYEYHFSWAVIMAYGMTKSEYVEKQFFDKGLFSPAEFLNEACALGYMSLNYCREFDKLFVNEMRSVSLSRLLSEGVGGFQNNSASEVDLYDCLVLSSPRTISLCFKYIDTDEKTKQTLKNCLFDRDEDLFVETLMKSGVRFSRVASALMTIFLLKPIARISAHIASPSSDELSINDVLCYPISNAMPTKEQINLKLLFDWQKPNCVADPNIDWFALYSWLTRRDYYFLYLHNMISNSCTDIDAVIKMTEYIQHDPDLKDAYQRINLGELNVFEISSLELDTLVNFRKKFINKLILPRAIEGKKNPKEYFVSNKVFRLEFIKNLYFTLVEGGLLSYDDTTYYSFVCRMDKSYKGEKDPAIIVWRGQPRELYHLIYWFVDDGDGRLWAKTADFFVNSDGQKFKTNGVKNQAVTPTLRMEKILKEFQAKFGQ